MGLADWLGVGGFILGIMNMAAIIYGLKTRLRIISQDANYWCAKKITQHPVTGFPPQSEEPCTAVQFRLTVTNRNMRHNSIVDIRVATVDGQELVPITQAADIELGRRINTLPRQLLGIDRDIEETIMLKRTAPQWADLIPQPVTPGEQVSGWVTGILPTQETVSGDHVALLVTLHDAAGNRYTHKTTASQSAIYQIETPAGRTSTTLE